MLLTSYQSLSSLYQMLSSSPHYSPRRFRVSTELNWRAGHKQSLSHLPEHFDRLTDRRGYDELTGKFHHSGLTNRQTGLTDKRKTREALIRASKACCCAVGVVGMSQTSGGSNVNKIVFIFLGFSVIILIFKSAVTYCQLVI